MMGNPYWSTSPEGATVMSMTMGISSSLMGAGGCGRQGTGMQGDARRCKGCKHAHQYQ